MAAKDESSDLGIDAMEKDLQSAMHDGILSDLVEVDASSLKDPRSVAVYNYLPFKLWQSTTFSRVLTTLLDNVNPGTGASYNEILAAIMRQTHTDGFCYVRGGQVRDLLMGKISNDVDIHFACTAKDVATVCVENEWPIKYIAIGTEGKPNYVLIGKEEGGLYMEGFSLSFHNQNDRVKQDFRRNMVSYDFTNHVIVDKTGNGVADIRNNEMRFACAPCKDMWEDWAREESTVGEKALRYVKFLMRGILRQKPLVIDAEESAFVAVLLKKALRENKDSLQAYWFRYLLGECLSKREGFEALYSWVCVHGGESWWTEWLPFVSCTVADKSWLKSSMPSGDIGIAKQAFSDEIGDGPVEAGYLKDVLHRLGLKFTDAEFEQLLRYDSSNNSEKLNVGSFLDFLIGA